MLMLLELLLNQNAPVVHISNNESEAVHCIDRVIITKEHYGIRIFKSIIIIGLVFLSTDMGEWWYHMG